MENENRLVVADVGWAETIPQWLKDEIASERMINGMIGVTNPEEKTSERVCDAEIVAYLMTASLRAPLSSDHTDIYLYISAKLMLKTKRILKEEDLPDFMQEIYKTGLSEWKKTQLNDLRSMMGRARGKVSHPIFDVLRELKGGIKKNGKLLKNSKK